MKNRLLSLLFVGSLLALTFTSIVQASPHDDSLSSVDYAYFHDAIAIGNPLSIEVQAPFAIEKGNFTTMQTIDRPDVSKRCGGAYGKQGSGFFILARNSLNRQEIGTLAVTKVSFTRLERTFLLRLRPS